MKKRQVSILPGSEPMEGRVIYDYQIRDTEGQLLTFLESLGLRESQEKSAKDIFRSIFYKAMYEQTIWVNGAMLGPVVSAAYDEARALQMQPSWSRNIGENVKARG